MIKSTTGILALLAGSTVVMGQGAISMANYATLSTYIYFGFRFLGGSTELLGGSNTGPPPTLSNYAAEFHNGNDWTVQLYGAVGANLPSATLSPLAGMTANFATGGSSDNTPGTWVSSAQYTFPGTTTGSIATVQLYVWYNDGGAISTYAQAVADGVPTDFSSTANVSLMALPFAPANLPPQLSSVPEVSEAMWLWPIGALAAISFLRRPQLTSRKTATEADPAREAIFQTCPYGSMIRPTRSPQNWLAAGRRIRAPAVTACAIVTSASST